MPVDPHATAEDAEVLLAKPRGFCAGVDRAIAIVERALEQHGAPIYVRHEIVHNKFVVDDLRAKGATVLGTGEPRIGAHGAPVIFVHPKDMGGVLVELMETPAH